MASQNLFQEEEGQEGGGDGKPGYIGLFAKTPSGQNIKRLLLIKENLTSQLKECVCVCVY